MENRLQILNALEIDLDLFYSITFDNSAIKLQGYANEKTIIASRKFVELKPNWNNSWLTGTKENLTITLTF